jgi:hypothetical protein
MFKTYKELMDSASFKGILRLHEDKRIAPLKAVNFFYKGRKIELPMLNTVIIPGKAANNFMGTNYLDFLIEWGLSFSVKYKTKKSIYNRKLAEIEGEKFYAYALHHGYDFGHHREPTVTGLFIHAKTLEASPETLIECYSQFYADLKKLECRKAFYTGPGVNPNPELCLEQKVRSLSDPELYSWG